MPVVADAAAAGCRLSMVLNFLESLLLKLPLSDKEYSYCKLFLDNIRPYFAAVIRDFFDFFRFPRV